MKLKNLFAGAAVALLAMPVQATAQTTNEPLLINGSVIDWYYFGRDFTGSSSGNTWNQFNTGMGTPENPFNYGLLQLGVDPTATDGKPVWLNDFPIRNHLLYGNAGGVYTGDAYYTFFMHEVGWEENMDGEYGSESWEILVRKWDLEKKTYTQVGRLHNQPTDLTYDPLSDKVYGIFYMSSGDEGGYKLGELNMETFQVTPISRTAMMLGEEMRCLAINSKGELYGIDASGNVAKIDKTNGALTYVGNTGVKSQRKMMSATFDLRTDKLYWVGYVNNGKIPGAGTAGTNETLSVADGGRDTGVYEVDTNTGKATLIGKTNFVEVELVYDANGVLTGANTKQYGKTQLTGIYVEGSFTRKAIDMTAHMTSAPVQMKMGEQGEIMVHVKNIGTKAVGEDDWKVVLYVDGVETATKSGRDLEPSESRDVKFTYTAPQKAGRLKVYAEVVNAADEEARNNKTEETEIRVLGNVLLPSVVLNGEQTGTNGLKLTWENPEGHITDGAEDYVAFTYDGLAQWTMVDGDKATTQRPSSYNMAVSYDNAYAPKAYIVFNPEKAGMNLTGSASQFAPYAGEQYFASFFSAVKDDSEAGGHQVQNNDWMISPELNGKAQTISFMARGYEGSTATGYETENRYPEFMRILYSTESTDTTTFKVAVDTFAVATSGWTKYTAELPAGAKYFALQCVSSDGLALMIDDIDFHALAKEVKGYVVYKNGELFKELDANTTSLEISRARNTDAYTVVAVYEDGNAQESNAVGIDILNCIDLTTVEAEAGAEQIYNLSGQRINSMKRGGMYVVKSGNKTRKVILK